MQHARTRLKYPGRTKVKHKFLGPQVVAYLAIVFISSLSFTLKGQNYQTRTPEKVAASYVIKLPRYIVATNLVAGESYKIGTPDKGMASELHLLIKKGFKTLQNRTLEIVQTSDPDELSDCQVVFIPKSSKSRRLKILDSLRGKPVILIGETLAFLEDGGNIAFQISPKKTMGYVVHLCHSKDQGLRIDPRLLRSAQEVLCIDEKER